MWVCFKNLGSVSKIRVHFKNLGSISKNLGSTSKNIFLWKIDALTVLYIWYTWGLTSVFEGYFFVWVWGRSTYLIRWVILALWVSFQHLHDKKLGTRIRRSLWLLDWSIWGSTRWIHPRGLAKIVGLACTKYRLQKKKQKKS